MGVNKKYDGYRAYDYLEKNVDYQAWEMREYLDGREDYLLELSAEDDERARAIARDQIVISLHEHPTCLPKDLLQIVDYTREGRDVCAYERLSQSCYDVVFDNMLDGTTLIRSKNGWKWEDILYDIGMRLCDLEHQSMLMRCRSIADFELARASGRICLIPAVEGAALIENELDRIDVLFGFGVRMMGIAYSESNGLASGIKEERDGGLTSFGREAVRRMNQVGMAIDCSHTAYQSTLDVIAESEKPIFLTHVGSRSLSESKRMFPDEVLKACADRGGVIGVEAAPHTTISAQHPRHSIESVFDHFDHLVSVCGIDHLAFGPDTLYGDHVGLHDVFAKHFSKSDTQTSEHETVPYVEGMENPTETSHNLIRMLIRRGYSDDDIEKVLSGNIIRVLSEVWPQSIVS